MKTATEQAIRFVVHGDAVSFGTKTTTFQRGGRLIRGTRKTDAAADWEAEVRRAAAEAMGERPLFEGPVEVLTTVIFSLPRSQYRKRNPVPRTWSTKKRAEGDKVDRLVHDAMTGVVYADDCQVARHAVQVMVGAQGEPAKTTITVRPLPPVEVA